MPLVSDYDYYAVEWQSDEGVHVSMVNMERGVNPLPYLREVEEQEYKHVASGSKGKYKLLNYRLLTPSQVPYDCAL